MSVDVSWRFHPNDSFFSVSLSKKAGQADKSHFYH